MTSIRSASNRLANTLSFARSLSILCLALCSAAFAQTQTPISGQPVPSLSQLDTIMQTYMAQYNSPGATLAVTVDGRLVFARGYGYAKVDTGEFVQPDSLFRIASNSKPITAAGIYKLIEQGKLSLTTQPFATILNNLTPPPGTTIDPRYNSITIQQLLQHTAGFDDTTAPDPAQAYPVTAATAFGAQAPATPQLLIKYMLGQSLQHDPGTTYAYSNLGYIILGYIIEQVSGVPYATYIQNNVFNLANIQRTQPGATLLAGRLPNEVTYYDYPNAPLVSSVEPPVGSQVPYPYGGYSCTLQLANGCWVSSTMDLLRFTDSINGQFSTSIFNTPPSSSPFRTPQLYFAVPPSGSGWEYIFYGSLPGTNSLVHLFTGSSTTGKVTYSAIFNTRNGANIEEPGSDADNAIAAFVKTVKSWPTGDLFPNYSGTGSACNFTLNSTTQAASANGGTFTSTVTDANYCAWSAVSNTSWIHVTSGALNSDSGGAVYTVDANSGAPRTGTVLVAGTTLTVSQAGVATPTNLSLTANPTAITAGQSVALTATLSPYNVANTSTSTNGETITFLNNGTSIGTATLTNGVAALNTTALPGGTDSVTATYPGDSTFGTSTSGAVQVTVTKATATVTLGSLTATYNGSAHAATATTSPAGLTVTFTYNGSSTAPTAAGTYAVVATVSDPSYTGTASGSLVIAKAAATVTLGGLSAMADGTAHAATATTNPAGLAVTFTYNGSATIPSAAGSYAVVATINDPNYTGSATGTLVIAVPLTASNTTLTSSAASVPVGTSVTFTATVTGTGGTPTGTVTFLNGSATLGTGTLNASGVATFTTSFSAAGTSSITAQYGGDAAFKASTSTALSETVIAVGVSATVSPSPLTIKSGSSGTLTITLTPTGGYTGTVSLGCGTLPANASCTFAPTSVAITANTTTATDTLTINTTVAAKAAVAALSTSHNNTVLAAVAFGLPGSFLALLGIRQRKHYTAIQRLALFGFLCFATLAAGAIGGCGSSSGGTSANSTTTPTGSYTVPVTLTLTGGTAQTVNATVVVQ